MTATSETTALAIAKEQRDPFSVMDSWDDEALLAEFQGAIAKSLVYEFKQGGETITGLSKVGVDECCLVLSEQGQVIREQDLTHEIIGEGNEREALFQAKAARYAVSPTGEVLLDTVIGVKRQALYDMRRGALLLNPFWYETGAMKAVRNARFRLIPSKVREGVIAEAKKKGAVRSNRPVEVKAEKEGNGQAKAEAADQQALKEIEALMPGLSDNQREWVREKLGDGALPVPLLAAVKLRAKDAARE